MHLDSGAIQQVLHGEIPSERMREVTEHRESCALCSEDVSRAEAEEREIAAAFDLLDHPTPAVSAASVMRSVARSSDTRSSRTRSSRPRWLRRAALFLLGLGIAGGAYALPGSPVRDWVSAVRSRLASGNALQDDSVQVFSPTDGLGAGGISVDPGDRLVIEVSGVVVGGAVVVRVTPGRELEASVASGPVSFTSDAGRLAIDGLGSDTLDLTIPEGAPSIELRVNGRSILLKDGGALSSRGEQLNGLGPFVLPLSPTTRGDSQ